MASYSYGMEQHTIAADALDVATNICSTHVVDLERSISRQEKISRSENIRLLQQELSYWKEFRANFEAIDRKHDSESFNINVLALLGKMKNGLIAYNEKEQKELKAMLSEPFLFALEAVDRADKARTSGKLSKTTKAENVSDSNRLEARTQVYHVGKPSIVSHKTHMGFKTPITPNKPSINTSVNTLQLYQALSDYQIQTILATYPTKDEMELALNKMRNKVYNPQKKQREGTYAPEVIKYKVLYKAVHGTEAPLTAYESTNNLLGRKASEKEVNETLAHMFGTATSAAVRTKEVRIASLLNAPKSISTFVPQAKQEAAQQTLTWADKAAKAPVFVPAGVVPTPPTQYPTSYTEYLKQQNAKKSS